MRSLIQTVLAISIAATCLYGCADNVHPDAVVQQAPATAAPKPNYDSMNRVMADTIASWFKGAGFEQVTSIVKTYYFSDNKVPDTFVMEFAKGEIARNAARFYIKAHTGHVIYDQQFPATWFFSDMMEEMQGTNNEDHRVWRAKTPVFFTSKLLADADTLMTQLPVTGKVDIWKYVADIGELVDTSLAVMATKDTSVKWIYLPCLGCYEGGCYMVYDKRVDSAKEVGCND